MRFRAWDQQARNVKHFYLQHVLWKLEIKLELQFQNCMSNTYLKENHMATRGNHQNHKQSKTIYMYILFGPDKVHIGS